ncbi:MAG: hypothetical protein J1F02_01410 [Lachnospiraceae bacterium]|nr:hypothetical protein [Lachnospiraceae bacterium]
MRKQTQTAILVMGLIFVLAGCGLQNTAGESTGTSSGSAVSGEAASVEFPSEMLRSPLCNDSNYYEEEMDDNEKYYWNQMALDGTRVDAISVEPATQLQYVTNEEIIYSKQVGEEKFRAGKGYGTPMEIWSVPLQKTDTGDKLQWEKKTRILKTYVWDIRRPFYADENYIAYMDCYDFCVYDRQAEKFLSLKGNDLGKKGTPNSDPEGINCIAGKNIFFICKYEGLYHYAVGADSVECVDEKAHGSYSFITIPKKSLLIYQRCGTGQECDGENNHGDKTWYVYDYTTGEKKQFITKEQWQQAYEEAGVMEEYYKRAEEEERQWNEWWGDSEGDSEKDIEVAFEPVGEFFLEGDTIYSIKNGFAFSIDMQGDQTELKYEEDLSNAMFSLGYDEWDVTKVQNGKIYFKHKEPTGKKDEEGYPEEWICTKGYYDLAKKEYTQTRKWKEKDDE